MLNINNDVSHKKNEILVQIIKAMMNKSLENDVHFIPRKMVPRDATPKTCCIFHDRELLRQRTIAQLGFSLEEYDDEKPLALYAKEALAREKPSMPILTFLHEACNACVTSHYLVTNACQGCLARPCMMNCPKKAITVGKQATIDATKCINCGMCMQNCPYHAIIKIPVPCEEACPVGAITKDEQGKERIDYDKCIFCGNCMRNCPFGAIMTKSQLVDVFAHILNGKKVVAMYAPAIAAQFRAKPGQLESALKQAGFSRVWEVAIGADVCADNESKEFQERMERGDKLMTTSCCPAYVRAVRVHVPSLNECVSETRTPMHYTAEIAKKADPDCITVFIGPCVAKRYEGANDDLVDYVLSIQDIGALLMAKNIEVASLEPEPDSIIPTASGRNFAVSGGVAESIKVRLPDPSILRPGVINGLNKAGMAQLATYGKINSGAMPTPPNCANLVEVMACEGGCVGGPAVITNPKVATVLLKNYVTAGAIDADKMAKKE
ncbi:MAG: monomeric [FeFe] hydrogenase [Treponema sp.]|nr:monomeric [FeFe] hydrogenase [Treponema sp.]